MSDLDDATPSVRPATQRTPSVTRRGEWTARLKAWLRGRTAGPRSTILGAHRETWPSTECRTQPGSTRSHFRRGNSTRSTSPRKPVSSRQVSSTTAIVDDDDDQRVVGNCDVDASALGVGVLYDVGEGLGTNEVRGRGKLFGGCAAHFDVQFDRQWCSSDETFDSRDES